MAVLEIDKCLTVEVVKNLRLSGMENLQVFPRDADRPADACITVVSGRTDAAPESTHGSLIYAAASRSVGAVSSIPESSALQGRICLVNAELGEHASNSGSFQPTLSIVGAVCAQEVVKLVTGHKPPINNTFLIDALELRSSVKCL